MTTTAPKGRIRLENSRKRVRVFLGGELIADSTDMLLVWEKPYYPVYYFPQRDVRMELLSPSGDEKKSPSRGTATLYTVKGGSKVVENAAYGYDDPKIEGLADHVAFMWDAMDSWFEEDEEVFVHARDPYTRIDALPSSRHIEVKINGVTVADSTKPTLLFETGLPTRYYLPLLDVRMDLLRDSDTTTYCPYKGEANYFSVELDDELIEDIVWYYKYPVEESSRIAGMVSFYNEKVDIFVDGDPEPRPKTQFS
ncbi:MAG: DUF427 domain-containing protein [Acidimicrobiia bacterium]|nr:DUF427 domain-containing protein [Acidimicrobiia bacterium]NNL69268.1 DUF427 domain-containing protein [Acidimicrobiia bacterium]